MDYELTQAIDFGRDPTELEIEIATEYPPTFLVGEMVYDIHSPTFPWEVKIIFWSDYFATWVYSSGITNTFIGQSDLRQK